MSYSTIADKFVRDTEWGFIPHEFINYINKQFRKELRSAGEHAVEYGMALNSLAEYRARPPLRKLDPILLQTLHNTPGIFSTNQYTKATCIIAKNNIHAFARLFIEIEANFNNSVKSKWLNPRCGYKILSALNKSKGSLNIPKIMAAVGYPRTAIIGGGTAKPTISKLLDELVTSCFISEYPKDSNKFILHPIIKNSFKYADKIKGEVLKWEYRANWF